MSVVPVSYKPALIIGSLGGLIVFLGLSMVLREDPHNPQTNRTKGLAITLGLSVFMAIVAGGITYNVMFSMANPALAATNFAIAQTRNSIFGR